MDIIKLTKDLGVRIQEDDRYLNYIAASRKNDKDEKLQALIKEFNLKKISVHNEAAKDPCDEKKIKKLNNEIDEYYDEIMENESMKNYKVAKIELDNLVRKIVTIIVKSAKGEDPSTADSVESNCSGGCSNCSGCY